MLAVVFLVAVRPGTASGQAVYQIVDLGLLSNGQSAVATKINNRGQVVGYSHIFNNEFSQYDRAFLWQNGAMTDLGTLPGFFNSVATGTNNKGEIVGYVGAVDPLGSYRGFLWRGGTMTDLSNIIGQANGNCSGHFAPSAINDSGQIVGSCSYFGLEVTRLAFLVDGSTVTDLGFGSNAASINNRRQAAGQACAPANFCARQAALWQNGVTTILGLLQGGGIFFDRSQANDINDFRQAVGWSSFQSGSYIHGFFWENGKMSDVGTLGGLNSEANGINAYGQVVGQSQIDGNVFHAFLETNGVMVDLNSRILDNSGWELTSATDINDSGQIVGFGTHLGQTRAFLLAPFNGISPDRGGNTGNVTARIVFSGLQTGANVRLTGTGQQDITGNDTEVLDLENTKVMLTRLDLRGAVPGIRSVVVTEPDGTSMTLLGGFTIEQGGTPLLSVDIVGSSRLRVGRDAPFYVVVKNEGLVDAELVELQTTVEGTGQLVQSPAFGKSTPMSVSSQAAVPSNSLNQAFSLGVGASRVINGTLTSQSQGCGALKPRVIRRRMENQSCNGLKAAANGVRKALEALHTLRLNALIHLMTKVTQHECYDSCSPTNNDALCSFTLAESDVLGHEIELGDNISEHFLCDIATTRGCPEVCQLPEPSGLRALEDTVQEEIHRLKELSRVACAIRPDPEYSALVENINGQRSKANDFLPLNFSLLSITPEPNPPPELLELRESIFDYCFRTSWDPNEKQGMDGFGEVKYVRGELALPYTIFFENLATATAPAQQVFVTDQLDPNLDWSTLTMDTIRFRGNTIRVPTGAQTFTTTVDLRPDKDLLVNIETQLNLGMGILSLRFISIDPATGLPPTDPLEGFLPPNITPPEGEAAISFTIMARQGLPTSTQIQNQATIVFDANRPISTQTWLNTLDNTAPSSQVLPLPANEIAASFPVQWTGTDVGSGIQDFTIYVSDNGGPFTAFQTNTTATSATFNGQAGHTYSFYSTARDNVGNVEAAPSVPDAVTVIGGPLTITAPTDVTSNTGPGATTCGAVISDTTLGTATANIPGTTITRTGVPPGNLFPVGATTVTYTAVDTLGRTATATQKVTVMDNTPPTITAPAAITAFTGTGSTMCGLTITNLGTANAHDNCSVAISRSGVPANNFFPIGTTKITYTATDGSGNTATATQNITVVDNMPPTVTAPASITAYTGTGATSCGVIITNLGTANASDNCSVALSRSGMPANSFFPVGTTTITYTAIDPSGNTKTAQQAVTVIDNTPPVITLDPSKPVDPSIIWPPDKKMVLVTVNYTAMDNCDPSPTSVLSVNSNEGTSADWEIIDAHHVKLRAGRAANGIGRIYTIKITSTDRRGNSGSKMVTVTVPHDQGH